MRIAQVAPLAEAVPPRLYGGTERVVSWLTEALVRLGHEVTLFASGDSVTSASLVACAPRALRLAGIKCSVASHLVMLDHVRRHADEFDLIHFHVDLLQHVLFQDLARKTVTTLHGRLDLPDFHPVFSAFPNMPLVSVSEAQRKGLPSRVEWLATVPHGLPAHMSQFHPSPGSYLAFLGRIAPEKRVDRAIEIAKRAGLPLKIAAKVDHVDRRYFEERIEPLLDHPLIEFIGEIGDHQKDAFLGNALALLFPIDWPEPFGLVMIEAMATGTPVIAWRQGSVPEVIPEGIGGYIVDTIEQAVERVAQVPDLSRAAVRQHFEQHFTDERMARGYLAAYETLLSKESSWDADPRGRADYSDLGANAALTLAHAFQAAPL